MRVFGPATKYRFQWATNRNGGNLFLEEAYITHAFTAERDLALKVGQYKDVTFHEEITSSKRLLAVDRSLMNEVLAGVLTFVAGTVCGTSCAPPGGSASAFPRRSIRRCAAAGSDSSSRVRVVQ